MAEKTKIERRSQPGAGDQTQAGDPFGSQQRQFPPDIAAHGMADQMDPWNLQRVEKIPQPRRKIPNMAAADVQRRGAMPRKIHSDGATTDGQSRQIELPAQPVAREAMKQKDRNAP